MKPDTLFLARRRRKRSNHPWNNLRCYIDVTGLVSVMIVLLMIYIYGIDGAYCPHCSHGVPVDAPKVNHPIPMRGAIRDDALLVSVTRDNKVYFGIDYTRPDDLPAMIREGVSHGAERKVYINADARARYGTVSQVLEGVSSAGIQDVGFLVWPRATPTATPIAQSLLRR